MGKGIHGNDSCTQCGACCVYFRIMEDDSNLPAVVVGQRPQVLFKEAREACRYLKFDDKNEKTYCSNYDKRPGDCKEFGCYDGHSIESRGREAEKTIRKGLVEIARNMFVDKVSAE